MLLGEQTWKAAETLTDRVVVVPLTAFEQHGHHLPLLTDALIGTEIARRAEAALGDEALFLPTLWLGASDHHRAMAGTVSLANDTYVRVLVDILESLIGGGYRRIFLLNAHGGNITPARMALFDVQMRHRDKPDLWIAFSSWWQIAAEQVAGVPDLQTPHVTHACELETSIVLRLRPELVKMVEAAGAKIPFESAFYYPDASVASRVDVIRPFDQLSMTGAILHPERATPEKGEALLKAAAAEVVAFVREFAHWPQLRPG